MNTRMTDCIVQPYLFFEGRCEEALRFYQEALGAEVDMLMHYKDSPEPAACDGPPPPGDKVMHASFHIGETMVMASDGRCQGKPSFQGFALSISLPSEAEADRRFAALAKEGQVVMPMETTFFARHFGMVTDRFGIMWMIIVPAEEGVPAKNAESMVS